MSFSPCSFLPDILINKVIGALKFEPIANYFALTGKAHTCQRVISLASGMTNLWFDPTTISNTPVPVLGPFFKTDSADVTITLFFGSTYTGGTEAPVFNRLEGGPACQGKVIEGGTVDAVGVEAGQYLLSSGFLSGGTQSADAVPFGKLNNSPVRVQIDSSGNTSFEYRLTWFEL